MAVRQQQRVGAAKSADMREERDSAAPAAHIMLLPRAEARYTFRRRYIAAAASAVRAAAGAARAAAR